MLTTKQELRQQLREVRSLIPDAQRDKAAVDLCNIASQLDYFSAAKNVAFYWPHDNEISPMQLLHYALQQHKQCFLPVLVLEPHQKLAFASYALETPLINNRYNIPEPELNFSSIIELTNLDLIFVPLVGFDSTGRRLGRGGGFYDATFAELRKNNSNKQPKLIGLGYSCQRIDNIPTESWDWQLDAIVTENRVFDK